MDRGAWWAMDRGAWWAMDRGAWWAIVNEVTKNQT